MHTLTFISRQNSGWFAALKARLLAVDCTAVAAFVLPFLLYARTLAPTIYNLDSAELTTAVASNGIIRATGYPLYLVVGKIWSYLPVGDMGYRMNLFSAFCGALTILLADCILRRLPVSGWARLGALGLLATAPFFWALSVIAEVYTLHTALMAGVILALLYWADQPSPIRLALPIFLMALSMGNHAATVLLLPGCLWYVLVSQPRQLIRPRVWMAAFMALALGASVFLALPLRYAAQPDFNYAGMYDASGTFQPVNLQTWAGFWWLISGKSFAGQMFGYSGSAVWWEVQAYLGQLWGAFLVVGIGPGLLGLVVLWRRNWRLSGMLTLMFLANAIFYINYRVVDKTTMFLPTYVVWAIWLGVGYEVMLREIGDWRLAIAFIANRQLPISALRIAIVGSVLLALLLNWGRVDRSDDWSTREQSEEILALAEPNALIFGWWETVPAIQYLQFVEGQRGDVTAVNRFLISGADMNELILAELGRRPIYVNNPSVELLRHVTAKPVGPLYLLEPRVTPEELKRR
ncbi:MAG: DUF2723 domain-containing protein [Chloroflexi bacterium]|nr:DUF2723 domain-containing protein [Ardenticatenaceae bacterium]NOG34285.1 DUF2723 domain-containing protein [Chloroflexota bacterium]